MQKPIDVLFVARDDWANVAYNFAGALQRVGVSAKAVKEFPHAFYKGQECEVVQSTDEMRRLLKVSKCVCIMHSTQHKALKQLRKVWQNKFVGVFHGGKAYRQGYRKLNAIYNKLANVTLIQTHDLLGLGARDPVWITPPVDVKLITPHYYRGGPYKIGHYPRDATLKRTKTIKDVMQRVIQAYRKRRAPHSYGFDCSEARLPWPRNIERMSSCDIYLVSMSVVDALGYPTAEWGYTAIEAAAGGCVVLTAFRAKDEYEAEFGPCPIPAVTSAEDLVDEVRKVIEFPETFLPTKQAEYRKWAEGVCSYEAVGERLVKAFKKGL